MLEMDVNMFNYFIYGLRVSSEIQLYNIAEAPEGECDVKVYKGSIDDEIKGLIARGITSSMNPERVWFINDSGVFVIRNGSEIIVTPSNDSISDDELGSFVLGWGISFLFAQRGIPAIHSTAIDVAGKAILISGNSGAGKSTTALAMMKRGYKYLADDIAMVDIKNDMTINPGFPVQKVCRDVAGEIEESKLKYVNEKKDKFAYFNTEDFCNEPRKLKAIYIISKYDGNELTMEMPKGLDKWNAIANTLFLLDAYRCLSFPAEEKKRCLEIAGKADVYVIKRPANVDTLDAICDFIEKTAND